MFTRRALAFALVATVCVTGSVAAQLRDPISPGVGHAVLLATNSIQLDRDTVVVSGDVVVNDASPGPWLGEAQLALDQNARTPAGARLMADSIDIDRGAVIASDVFFNTLTSAGTITGSQFEPLAVPVFARLPEIPTRPAGAVAIAVPDGTVADVPEGAYDELVVGNHAVARLTGGGYTFSTISIGSGGSLLCTAACNVLARLQISVEAEGSVTGPDAAQVLLYAGGKPGAPAARFGRAAVVHANVFAPAGTIEFGQGSEATGAFFARDLLARRGSRFTLDSSIDHAPTADPQLVFTNGANPLAITLTASDPEGQPLTFSIVTPPSQGSLSPVVGSLVTYTPFTAGNLEDAFTFAASDPAGNIGTAVVRINPPRVEVPPDEPTTVVAHDASVETTQNIAATLNLPASAPDGVTLSFSIVANSGPSHGTAVPGSTEGTAIYTPDPDYTGPDAFDFEVCGTISGSTVCDTATLSINVLPYRVEVPELASDVNVSTAPGQQVLIALGPSMPAISRFAVRPTAAFLDSAEVGGTVADADGDGVGDNHMPLPADVPVFMSAGTELTGSAGANGNVRMELEWDISSLGGTAGALQSADVILHTHRGTIDSLNTYFWFLQKPNDGLLTDSDFAGPAERIHDAVMSVPQSMAVGDEGTFSFSVLAQLKAALEMGFTHLTIQGRVEESFTGPARGLEVRTSVSLNRDAGLEPVLSLTTPGVTPPLTYTILNLPSGGFLLDGKVPITTVPHVLSTSQVFYVPNQGFLGGDSFGFQVSNGVNVDSALAHILVALTTCAEDPTRCDNGR